jgi:hypothetical protein
MKKLLNRIFVVGAVCLLCLHSGQGSVLDQSQPIFNNNVGGYFNGGSSRQKIAQVVTPGISGWLTTVAAPVTGLGTLRLEIRGVSAGLPNDTQLASQNIAGSSLPSFFSDPTGFRQLNLSVPPLVSAGEPFAIVLSALNPPMGSLTVLSGPPGDRMRAGTLFTTAFPIRRTGFTGGILDRSIFRSKPTLNRFQSRPPPLRSRSCRFSSAHWRREKLDAALEMHSPEINQSRRRS